MVLEPTPPKVTNLEINEALFNIGDDKSPGLDRFSPCFFKKTWSIVRGDVTKATKEFFAVAALLKQANHTILCLIPKSSYAPSAHTTFIRGRNMSNNIHIMQELLRNYNYKRISLRYIIKIGIQKAFDSVNWDFLHDILEGLGFPNIFVALMRFHSYLFSCNPWQPL